MDKTIISNIIDNIHIDFLLTLYFCLIESQKFLMDIICQINKEITIDNIILKAMALPHSGGKNQGDIASNGRNKIKKNPVKYSEYNLSEDTLFFIYFYDINKTLKKQTIVVEKRKIVITSGYFNPIHIGHLNLLKAAKDFGDFLVVIVNNDNQVKAKKSAPFMSETERVAIIKDLKYVDEVFLSIDNSLSIAESLKTIAKQYSGELFFAKGGDRNSDNIPNEEKIICEKFKIKVINGVGGGKVQSSSWILNNIKKS